MDIKIKKIDLKKIAQKATDQKSSWQKGIFLAALLSLLIFAIASAYLFFRPLNQEVKKIVEEEISSSNIIFDQKTIENIKKRYQPQTNLGISGSKDPFAQF